MALSPQQQFATVFAETKRPVIVFPKNGDVDDLAASLALAQYFKSRGVVADVVSDGFVLPSKLAFLPGASQVRSNLDRPRPLVISVDVGTIKADELRYDVVDGRLKIVVTPKAGGWSKEDVRVEPAQANYDLLITVGAADRQQLGAIAETSVAFGQPVLVIDHDAANERFGSVNAVDVTASSACEAMARALGEAAFADAEVATCLLAGMTAATRGYRTANVSPATLALAGKLTAAGARRTEIVDHLYRTTSLSTMKLWGRALSRIKYDPASRLTWTVLIRQDVVQCGAGDGDLAGLIDQLLANAADADVVAVVHERDVAGGRVEIWAALGSDRFADLTPLLPTGALTERLGRHLAMKLNVMSVTEAEKIFIPMLAAATANKSLVMQTH